MTQETPVINNAAVTVRYKRAAGVSAAVILDGNKARTFPLDGRMVLGTEQGFAENYGCFTCLAGVCLYSDMEASAGSIYKGNVLSKGQIITLSPGEYISASPGPDENEKKLVFLSGLDHIGKWTCVALDDSVISIGVGRSETIALDDPAVSRHHAAFFHASKGWSIVDLGSTNGVYLNGRLIDRPEYLNDMDIVFVAGHTFIYTADRLYYDTGESPDSVSSPENAVSNADSGNLNIDIREKNVWLRAKKKTILKDVRLSIPPGRLVLVLGGSGAGKTTFFNAVMGYEKAEGTVTYRGIDIYEEYNRMKYEIGYVPQQDLLRMNDSVFSTLMNAAEMRLDAGLGREECEKKVYEVLEIFGLTAETDNLVGKLSGGQRKRLSTAVEYIGNPSLFFLDEPDSGLDSTNAKALFRNLRAIADEGRTVLVISHSPDRVAEFFDDIIVLAKAGIPGEPDSRAGRLVFFGEIKEAYSFFDVSTIEDIVMLINTPEEGGKGLAEGYIKRFEEAGKNG